MLDASSNRESPGSEAELSRQHEPHVTLVFSLAQVSQWPWRGPDSCHTCHGFVAQPRNMVVGGLTSSVASLLLVT